MSNLNFSKIIWSMIGITYVWSLPLLAKIGFTETHSTSISEFIANPPATGAMAAISFMPLCLMWEYQDFIISKFKKNVGRYQLYISLSIFQIFYGSFLICTVHYVPNKLHTAVVTIFGLSFLYHSYLINKYIQPNKITLFILIIGLLSFASLLCVKGIWFWAMECIGFSSMLLFTPIDWYLLPNESRILSSYIELNENN